jgi:hypothetical protein
MNHVVFRQDFYAKAPALSDFCELCPSAGTGLQLSIFRVDNVYNGSSDSEAQGYVVLS